MMRKKKPFFQSGFIALITCFMLTLSGYAQAPCTNTSISSFFPSTGPVGTVVTLTGTGFDLGSGTSSVKFNGLEAASFTVVSATTIQATVPQYATNGAITIITNGCSATRAAFSVMIDNCNEIYISEAYDATEGNPGAIEIYNPTENTIVFNNQYVLERYQRIGDPTPVNNYILTLTGSIGSEETYIILSGDAPCGIPDDRPTMGNGINADDEFKLKKNGTIIDVLQVQGGNGDAARGYNMIRRPLAVGPSRNYSNADWIWLQTETCDYLGFHDDQPKRTTTQGATICENTSYTFTATSNIITIYTYQWKTLNASGNWVNVTNGGNYSGATTASLTISNIPASFNGNQYYCEIGAGNCTLPGDAAQLIVIPNLPTVIASATATDCATQTATVTVTSTLPATGITYSIDGGTPQASNIFNGVAASSTPHTITITDTNGTCPPVTGTITVAPVVTLPTVIASATATDCATQTATVTVTSTLPATGITYSIDGGAPQASNIFNGVAASSTPHTITITDTNGTCPPVTGTITVA
ncbi:hypothetical protein GR160_14980, partial [Flavobacterium sp. Sd200]|uniref:IPT/TIG domain-containing protein n=1 Tax=Flavobacterium sp. Sd200 TaxID=2692211 RepID=UPI00144D7B79